MQQASLVCFPVVQMFDDAVIAAGSGETWATRRRTLHQVVTSSVSSGCGISDFALDSRGYPFLPGG